MARLAPNDISFSWNGLPQYAARLIRAAIEQFGGGQSISVIGTRPSVPVEGMEAALGQPIHWVDVNTPQSWSGLGLPVPKLFFQSGWSYPALNALGKEVKEAGGHVIGLSDANWRGDFRQLVLGQLAFRLQKRKLFDAMIVPGKSGRRLMRSFGLPEDRLFTRMYGADPALFFGGPPLADRPKNFLFVGQFIDRKDVVGLSQAFMRFHADHSHWTLRFTGSGEQRNLIARHPAITVEDFVQPQDLAERYRQARFLVLPSKVEAWGLVVHEAALCGCGLVLSEAIGCGNDLADAQNAIRFMSGDVRAMEVALRKAATRSEKELAQIEATSRDIARGFGPSAFAQSCAEAATALGYIIEKTST